MTSWKQTSDLLSEEINLWKRIEQKNQDQIQQFEEQDHSLGEIEQYLQEKDDLLEVLDRIQQEMDCLKLAVEKEQLQMEQIWHQEIAQKTRQLIDLQASIAKQEQEMKQYFQKAGEEIREQIKKIREKRNVNQSYNPQPISEESPLLDEKQ